VVVVVVFVELAPVVGAVVPVEEVVDWLATVVREPRIVKAPIMSKMMTTAAMMSHQGMPLSVLLEATVPVLPLVVPVPPVPPVFPVVPLLSEPVLPLLLFWSVLPVLPVPPVPPLLSDVPGVACWRRAMAGVEAEACCGAAMNEAMARSMAGISKALAMTMRKVDCESPRRRGVRILCSFVLYS
jgi:hypothetical protein